MQILSGCGRKGEARRLGGCGILYQIKPLRQKTGEKRAQGVY